VSKDANNEVNACWEVFVESIRSEKVDSKIVLPRDPMGSLVGINLAGRKTPTSASAAPASRGPSRTMSAPR
jgi:hypothetical protein